MTGSSTQYVVFFIGIAYLMGSFPTGLLLGKLYGVDVRKEGSGNVGATNLYRTVGRKVGIITLIVDCLKGFIPVAIATHELPIEYAAWAGLAAFCGHVFSVFLKFKGGKGVATALGVFLAFEPLAIAVSITFFAVVMFIWRYVSLSSIVAATVMPLAVFYLRGNSTSTVVTLLISAIVIVRHHENIGRLLAGVENKFKA